MSKPAKKAKKAPKNPFNVQVDQIWRDNDPRQHSRRLKIVHVSLKDGKAHCLVGKSGKLTKIRLDRFNAERQTGYTQIIVDVKLEAKILPPPTEFKGNEEDAKLTEIPVVDLSKDSVVEPAPTVPPTPPIQAAEYRTT